MSYRGKYIGFLILGLTTLLFGCVTTMLLKPNSVEYDAFSDCYVYKDYEFEIISDPPGAKIEWNNEYIGTTPLKQIFNGNQCGLSPTIINAYPIYRGQYTQTKVIFLGSQRLPRRIYFDMNLVPKDRDYNIYINP